MNKIMTIYVPSLLVVMIAQFTLYFSSAHFKTSATVAVTSLLGQFPSITPIPPSCSHLHALQLRLQRPAHHLLHEGHRVVAPILHPRPLLHLPGARLQGVRRPADQHPAR